MTAPPPRTMEDVTVVVDSAEYEAVTTHLDAHDGQTTLTLRRRLAQKAYARNRRL